MPSSRASRSKANARRQSTKGSEPAADKTTAATDANPSETLMDLDDGAIPMRLGKRTSETANEATVASTRPRRSTSKTLPPQEEAAETMAAPPAKRPRRGVQQGSGEASSSADGTPSTDATSTPSGENKKVLGRSDSMAHSKRIAVTDNKPSYDLDEVLEADFEAGEFLAIRCEDPSTFWVAQALHDISATMKEVKITWLNADASDPDSFTRFGDDFIENESIICKVQIQEGPTKGQYILSPAQRAKVLQRLSKALTRQEKMEKGEAMSSEDTEEEEEEEEEEKKMKNQKKRTVTSRAGRSRSKSKSKSKARADNEDSDENDDSEAESTKPKRKASRKRASTGSGKPRSKARSAPASSDGATSGVKRSARRKLEPRNDIEVIENDPTFKGDSNIVDISCCIRCSNREAIRAVLTGNMELLKSVIDSKKHISHLNCARSPDMDITPLEYAVLQNNEQAVRLLTESAHNENRTNVNTNLNEISTGITNPIAFGHGIRGLKMSRGGREGNNAFTQDPKMQSGSSPNLFSFVSNILRYDLAPSMIDLLCVVLANHNFESYIADYVYLAVRAGNRHVAAALIERLQRRGGWGFNVLHKQSLSFDNNEDFERFTRASVTKKPTGNKTVSPFHCAAINPNPKYLDAMLQVNDGDLNIVDEQRRKAIHYAAACVDFAPMKYLVEKGASLMEGDQYKNTPLMIACEYGRLENVKYLLSLNVDIAVNAKNRSGLSALHLAAQYGHTQVIVELLTRVDSLDIDLIGIKGMTPLMAACRHGQFDTVKELIARGARAEKTDKMKRSPLLLAVRNGHLSIVTFLLRHGCDPNSMDSSGNTALHYAAAYGWQHILESLVSAGADYNAVNDWKDSVLGIAMLKTHYGCMKYLLGLPQIDVNYRDQRGRTLLVQCVHSCTEQSLEQLEFLLSKKKANVAIVDNEDNNAFHHLGLAVFYFPSPWHLTKEQKEEHEKERARLETEHNQRMEKALNLLLEYGLDINAVNSESESPLLTALKARNFPCFSLLLSHGAKISSSGSVNVVAALCADGNQKCLELLDALETQHKAAVLALTRELDDQGYPPVLLYVSKWLPCSVKTDEEKKGFELFKRFINRLASIDSGMLNIPVGKYKKYRDQPESSDDSLDAMEIVDDVPNPNQNFNRFNKKTNRNPFAQSHPYGTRAKQFHADSSNDSTDDNNSNKKKPSHYCDKGKWNIAHFAVSKGDETVLEFILQFKPDLNVRNIQHKTPLLMAAMKRSAKMVQVLVQAGADVSAVDVEGNTALHIAALYSEPAIASALIQGGADVNAKNHKGVTPLHLAVSKRSVAVVELLLSAQADVHAVDNVRRTPLHHAVNAATGNTDASFEVESLLIRAGADVNAVDARGRSPLHYAFVKIGAHKDTTQMDPIETVSSLCGVKGIQIDIVDAFGSSSLHYAGRRGATICSLYLLQRGAVLDRVDGDGNTALGLALESKHPDYAIMLIQKQACVTTPIYRYTTDEDGKKTLSSTLSMFRSAVVEGWQGVAYLMLDSGFDYMLAMQDALSAGRFRLVLTLLSKTTDDSIVQQTNPQGQNLFHALAMYASASVDSSTNWVQQVADQLLKRGVNIRALDKEGRSALHYAAMSCHTGFTMFLLSQGLDAKLQDIHKQTPLVCALKGSNITSSKILDLTKALLQAHPDPSQRYSDPSYPEETTLLIHIVRSGRYDLLELFLSTGRLAINEPDGLGVTALMHAVRNNDEVIFDKLLQSNADIHAVDMDGRTVLHHVVRPLPIGSYENLSLLRKILSTGVDVTVKDKWKNTALRYAQMQESGKMAKVFAELGHKELTPALNRHQSAILDWVDAEIDYESDAAAYIKEAESAKMDLESGIKPPPPDAYFSTDIKNFVVVVIGESIYDLLMTKVDVSKGAYGENMFYKMQVIRDVRKDLYILWTRWGRIGDQGNHQRTPFNSQDDATKEFEKVFKSKTGNLWENRDQFIKQHKKWNLMKIERGGVDVKDLLIPFEYDQCRPSTLSESIQKAMKQFCNVSLLNQSMKNAGIDTTLMPLGRLSKDTLYQARTILQQLKDTITALQTERSSVSFDVEKIRTHQEKLLQLSSEFYELLPHSQFTHCAVPPISNETELMSKINMIDSLTDMEIASKILLGAHYRKSTHSPLDYCFRALNVVMDDVSPSSLEYDVIRHYIQRTSSYSDSMVLENVFRLQRKGEAERITKWDHLDNHWLLWHGSRTSNFMGILSQGLRIAPPEAPVSGYMFGKGVYFADTFQKSYGYCQTYGKDSAFLLLCEVALGNMNELKKAEYLETAAPGFNSTKGVGLTGPDFAQSIVLQNGVTVPVGRLVNYPQTGPFEDRATLQHNEYIVYDVSQVRVRYMVQLRTADLSRKDIPNLANPTSFLNTFNFLRGSTVKPKEDSVTAGGSALATEAANDIGEEFYQGSEVGSDDEDEVDSNMNSDVDNDDNDD